MSDSALHLSIIVPCYNEAGRVVDTLKRVRAYLAEQDYTAEIIVADDGSTDGTGDKVRREMPEVRVLGYARNRGKGFAVRLAMAQARGEFRIVYDADGSTPVTEISKLWREFDAGADVVIGSRALPDSEIEAHQPAYREVIGKAGNLVLRILGLTEFSDTQCGFKAFTREAADVIFPRQVIDRFGADCEYLCIARLHRLRVVDIPVRWINSPDSRVHVIADTLRTLGEALRVRWYLWTGRYR